MVGERVAAVGFEVEVVGLSVVGLSVGPVVALVGEVEGEKVSPGFVGVTVGDNVDHVGLREGV